LFSVISRIKNQRLSHELTSNQVSTPQAPTE
jgi:hypothetical protein